LSEQGRLGWRFKGKTPLWFIVTAGLLLLNALLHFGMLLTISSWAQPVKDADHSYRLPFRDGAIYFVQPWIGEYLNAWWIGVGLLVALALLIFLNRDQLERG
jgi:hypothetical protein